MNMQTRAKRGGEVGCNGEFYEGGKYLPSTSLPKRSAARRHTGVQRALIEPGLLVVLPEGKHALYAGIREFVTPDSNGQLKASRDPDHPAHAYYFHGGYAELADRIERYNRGERYI
jgi:hypothetical protein